MLVIVTWWFTLHYIIALWQPNGAMATCTHQCGVKPTEKLNSPNLGRTASIEVTDTVLHPRPPTPTPPPHLKIIIILGQNNKTIKSTYKCNCLIYTRGLDYVDFSQPCSYGRSSVIDTGASIAAGLTCIIVTGASIATWLIQPRVSHNYPVVLAWWLPNSGCLITIADSRRLENL